MLTKGYDFKETTLSSFDSMDSIYQAAGDVVRRETPWDVKCHLPRDYFI